MWGHTLPFCRWGSRNSFSTASSANFNYPYISASITEFWRRWHMTRSGWFREYVYIPLGGNRKGLKRQIFNPVSYTHLCHGPGSGFHPAALF